MNEWQEVDYPYNESYNGIMIVWNYPIINNSIHHRYHQQSYPLPYYPPNQSLVIPPLSNKQPSNSNSIHLIHPSHPLFLFIHIQSLRTHIRESQRVLLPQFLHHIIHLRLPVRKQRAFRCSLRRGLQLPNERHDQGGRELEFAPILLGNVSKRGRKKRRKPVFCLFQCRNERFSLGFRGGRNAKEDCSVERLQACR